MTVGHVNESRAVGLFHHRLGAHGRTPSSRVSISCTGSWMLQHFITSASLNRSDHDPTSEPLLHVKRFSPHPPSARLVACARHAYSSTPRSSPVVVVRGT